MTWHSCYQCSRVLGSAPHLR